jgi:hypothetical protein
MDAKHPRKVPTPSTINEGLDNGTMSHTEVLVTATPIDTNKTALHTIARSMSVCLECLSNRNTIAIIRELRKVMKKAMVPKLTK